MKSKVPSEFISKAMSVLPYQILSNPLLLARFLDSILLLKYVKVIPIYDALYLLLLLSRAQDVTWLATFIDHILVISSENVIMVFPS